MSLLVHVAKGYFWSQLGRLAEVGLFFLLSLVLARQMGPPAYGILALGLSLVTVCGFVAAMGVGAETLGKFVPEAAAGRFPGGVAGLLRRLLVIRVLAVVALAGAVLLMGAAVERLIGVSGFRQQLGWILLIFALRSVCELFGWMFSGLLELNVVAASRVVVPLAALLIVVGWIWQGHEVSVRDSFAALALGQSAGLAVCVLAARHRLPAPSNAVGGQNTPLVRILTFGLFTWLAGFFIFVLNDGADVFLLGWLLKDPRQVGWYAIGANLIFRPSSLLLAWLTLLGMPTLANAYLRGGADGLSRAAEGILKLIAISLVPAMILLVRFSREFVLLLYSEQYLASVPVVRILGLFLALSGLLGFGLHAGVLYILDREKLACAVFAAAATFNLLLAVPLIKLFGTVGAAWATGVSFVLFSGLAAAVGVAANPLHWPWRFTLKVGFGSLVATLATMWWKPGNAAALAGGCGVWVLVFLVSLALAKPLSSRDSASLRLVSPQLGYVAERFFVRPA